MIVFTAIAGMASVAYMDVVIGLLATVTMLAALPILTHMAGGWTGVHAVLPATHFQVLGDLSPIQAAELFLPTCLLMLGNQSMYQKFFSAKSERDARNAVVGWVIGTVILETAIAALAVVGSALFRSGEVAQNPREVLAFSAMNGLRGSGALQLLGALMMGAIFAKIISTANNYLFSPATNLVNDVFVRYIRPAAGDRQVLLVSRLMVVLLGGWALWQSLGTESVLKKSLYAYTIYAAALTPVILAAFFWRRATAAAAVTSIALGTLVTVGWDTPLVARVFPPVIASRDAIIPALLVSVLSLVVVSLVTRAPSSEQLSRSRPKPPPQCADTGHMRRWFPILLLAAVLPAATAQQVRAGTAEAALAELQARATVIFLGTVESVERSEAAVTVRLRVEDAVRGASAGSVYTLREWPGLWMDDADRYVPGQRRIFFLHAPSAAGYASAVGTLPVAGNALTGVADLRWLLAGEPGGPEARALSRTDGLSPGEADGAIVLDLLHAWQRDGAR